MSSLLVFACSAFSGLAQVTAEVYVAASAALLGSCPALHAALLSRSWGPHLAHPFNENWGFGSPMCSACQAIWGHLGDYGVPPRSVCTELKLLGSTLCTVLVRQSGGTPGGAK